MMSKENAIEMFVAGLVLDPNTQAPVVVLKNEQGDIHLPIWIGIAEATSIASAIKQLRMARPLTHDLMFEIFLELGVAVQRVVITELRDSTYFAELILSIGDKILIFDARPSDAIAVAIRASAPIFVVEEVLEQAKASFVGETGEGLIPPQGEGSEAESDDDEEPVEEGDKDFKHIDKEKWEELLEKLDPDDFDYEV